MPSAQQSEPEPLSSHSFLSAALASFLSAQQPEACLWSAEKSLAAAVLASALTELQRDGTVAAIFKRHGVPIYFTGKNARKPENEGLTFIRKGNYEGLRDAVQCLLAEKVAALGVGMPWSEGVTITPMPDPEHPAYLQGLIEDHVRLTGSPLAQRVLEPRNRREPGTIE